MRFVVFLVGATLAFPTWALAAQTPALGKDDKYVACVLGRAFIFMHNGLISEKAQQAAYASCGKPPPELSGDDLEGASDLINSILTRLEQD